MEAVQAVRQTPGVGTVDAEIKVLSVGNPEPKGSPFKARSGLEYSHAGFTLNFFLELISTFPVHSPSFFRKPLPSFSRVSCG